MEAKITLKDFLSVYLRNYFIPTIVIIVVINSLSKWYPKIFSFENSFFKYGCVLVALYILYSTFKISSQFVYSINFSRLLFELKRENDGEERLLSAYNSYSNYIEENKLRLDIYKSFSPIPIVVFSLGILIKWDFNKLSVYFENVLNFKLELNSIIGGVILLLGIWYIISYRKCWAYHRNLLRRYAEVKTAYESLKIKEK
ncbi:hypothetical protein Q8G28_13565 [Lysinibacillus capsici]|uniref:hypothetical protein n=1 Tax=Lysinibacillus capsici TaxID=2115968 RepID=UPI0027312C13|nr:hypothetical protein [Lysinibacillus capsici]MDP1394438.1 hypothetical protein [Lysinibacillus capsici]MDP1414891.1 hypothetical protein [Lysinibacillus capsici]MDP1430786.1 hypothetical protein [Lysinibacillus capsici]